ncbi:hypothetical protein CTAYLR_004999 [Chrysophaeum taylorii]|uniref:Fe2OG dioxygenase domain-containing protein n=1 Tax=Chrysophaeum taylorii TaxID=2483200 RepID=A0AAD7UCB0_9STRA|nr:hypothetical protein CTAYLR_004999 [Chrysophaeum taylorii]
MYNLVVVTLHAALGARALLPVDLGQSRYTHVQVFDGCEIGCARELRQVFEDRFDAPRSSHPEQYFWHPWHVTLRDEDFRARDRGGSDAGEAEASSLGTAVAAAGAFAALSRNNSRRGTGAGTQYSLLRTPAAEYFEGELFDKLCVELAEFGRTRLGCDAFTPPWLALYTDGAEMNWHTDAPHGPLAFVLSLTPTGTHAPPDADHPSFFQGGETLILKPGVLDYWRRFDGSRGLEVDDILERHDPTPFGRIICFDGRLPHRVSRVEGTRDPRRGRLVLTGWFSEPRTRADGGLSDGEGLVPEAARVLDKALDDAFQAFEACDLGRVVGFLAVRVLVSVQGAVQASDALCDTLLSDPAERGDAEDDDDFATAPPDIAVKTILRAALFEATFPEASEPTIITVPLSFS